MSNRYVGGVITEKVNVAQAPWSGAWTEQAQLQAKAQGTWAPLNAQIGNSLRFRSSASAYLSRTPAAASNRMTWTWSAWVKRGVLGASEDLLSATTGSSTVSWFRFNTDNTLQFVEFNGSSFTANISTSAVYRDPSAWYHIVLIYDSTQATAANRVVIYMNGVQQTLSITTSPSQNMTSYVNSTGTHSIAKVSTASSDYFDGYMADINFIDGQALTPAAFGIFDANTGVWKPTVYGGTYGTNGFHLPFSNGTSTTTLGYDTSGNSNNWTCNNISLTAGSTYDWMLDSPTPLVGTSYGVGNYCVLNPLSSNSGITEANANLRASGTNTTAARCNGTMAVSSGKWYFETIFTTVGQYSSVGFGQGFLTTTEPGADALSYAYFLDAGQKYNNSVLSTYGSALTTNDVFMCALDLDNLKIFFGKNGTWFASSDPVSGANPAYTISAGSYTPITRPYSSLSTPVLDFTFGQRPFAYSPPSGYKTLCTYNLPAPAIANGANYMAATTYTGLGVAQAINNTVNGVYFQPDMVWVKSRSASQSNSLQDSVRGITLQLSSNLTTAEITSSGEVTALNATGFSLGGDVSGYGTNTAATTYIGWQWKAGGTAVTNTNGSITSQVSASALSGFSVVTYTGTGANATVGHGLGVAPAFIIVKNRTAAYNWAVYHQSVGATQWLQLNTTSAVITASNVWNNTAPTSSVFSIGLASAVNDATTFVAYCFAAIAGYSAFGSYTGNGSTDGPFVYCGFRPRYIMVKCTNNANPTQWVIWDTARNPYNLTTYGLLANTSDAELNNFDCDILSNGFKLRDTENSLGANGSTYIYAVFAENPFQNALAR